MVESSSISPSRPFIVAVDGPAGSGKSTVCAEVATHLGWTYVNTGAIYRAVGFIAAEMGVDVTRESAVVEHLQAITDKLLWDPDAKAIFYGDRNISSALGSVVASRNASLVAKMPAVRRGLLNLQRRLALMAHNGALIDGRDIGTVIFPDADLKIFLTASIDERARRRLEQLGVDSGEDFARIKREIELRDEQDSKRDMAPLRQAEDAVVVDTTGKSFQEVIHQVLELIKNHPNFK